jgi:hypothetical protein
MNKTKIEPNALKTKYNEFRSIKKTASYSISLHKDFSLALLEQNGIALCKLCHVEEEKR